MENLNLVQKFKIQVRNKLSQKWTANQSDEYMLMRAFKYFDQHDIGKVNIE